MTRAIVPGTQHIARDILVLRGQRALRSQFATLKAGRGQHRKYLPYAFTEHGAIMAEKQQ